VLHKDDGLELKSDWRRNGRAKPVKMDLTLTADVASLADRREREREEWRWKRMRRAEGG